MTILLALSAALFIGASDGIGAFATKRGPVLPAVLWMLCIGFPAALLVAPFFGGDPTPGDLAAGLVSGLISGVALFTLHFGYSRAEIGLVAPVTAVVAAGIPVVWGLASDGLPSTIGVVGLVVGVIAVALIASSPDASRAELSRTGAVLGATSGALYGVMAIVLGETSDESRAWPIVTNRVGAALVLASVGLVSGRSLTVPRRFWPIVVGAGTISIVGMACFNVAAQRDVAVAGLLVQFLFAVTIIVGVVFFGERSGRAQRWGFALAAVAVVCIGVA